MQHNATNRTFTVRRIVVTGLFGGIIILQSLVQVLGYPPIPIPPGNATTVQITVIIGAILEGPIVGLLLGLIFGLSSFLLDATGLFKNPFIAIVPRLFIGPVAYYAYIVLRRWSEPLGLAGAGVIGSLTNTVLVVGALILFGLLTAEVIPVLTPVIVIESALAAILTAAVISAVRRVDSGEGHSSV